MAKQVTEYDTEITKLESIIKTTKTELGRLQQARANELSPYKIGDIVNRKGMSKQQAVITRILLNRWSTCGYELEGKVLLKSGEQGKVNRTLYSWSWELKED